MRTSDVLLLHFSIQYFHIIKKIYGSNVGHNLKTKYKQKNCHIYPGGEATLSTPGNFEHLSSIFNIEAEKQTNKKLDGI